MEKKFNKDKWIIVSILPVMWLIYFAFEIITGRVNDLYTLILNLSLIFVFGFVGYLIYILGEKFPDGFSGKTLFMIFSILMIIEQGIKIIIKFNFFDYYFEIIPNFLSFNPIINTHGSWLNARFDLNVSFGVLITINLIALFLFFELYRYLKYKSGKSNFWGDMCFLFILSGALCSLIDKVFYGGSLDYIGISNLFIADLKDIYINIGLLFFIVLTYKTNYLSQEDTSFKDDIQAMKNFILFIRNDIKRK